MDGLAVVAGHAVDDDPGRPVWIRLVASDERRGRADRRPVGGRQLPRSRRRGPRVALDDRERDEPPGPVDEPGQEVGHARVGGVGDECRRPVAPVAGHGAVEPADPTVERVLHVEPRREHVGVVPVGVEQDADDRPVGVEVAGVFVGLDDGRPPLPQPDDRRLGAGQDGRQHGPDERRRVEPGPDEEMDEPAGRGRLTVGPGDRQEVAAAGGDRVCDELLAADGRDAGRVGGVELGLIGIDRGQGLRHGDPVDDGAPGGVHDVVHGVAPGDRDPRPGNGLAVVGRPAGVAAACLRPGGAGQDERGRGRRAGGAEDVDPLSGGDRTGRSGRLEPARDLLDAPGHRAAGRRVNGRTRRPGRGARPRRGGARGRPGRSTACWLPGRPPR